MHIYKQSIPILNEIFQKSLQRMLNKLSSLAQKALTSYKVLELIKNTKQPTNQELLKAEGEHKIKTMRGQLLKNRLISEGIVEERHYREILKIFDLNQGLPFNCLLNKQESVLFATCENTQTDPPTKSLTFFPTHVTTNLLKSILQVDRKQVIFGIKGIGKTISSLLITHLCSTITEFRVKQHPDKIKIYVDYKLLLKIPKIIYVSLQVNMTIDSVVESVQKNHSLKLAKIDYCVFISGTGCWQIKQETRWDYAYRMIMYEDMAFLKKDQNMKKVHNILMKKGYVSEQNGKLVINHSPLASRCALNFSMSELRKCWSKHR